MVIHHLDPASAGLFYGCQLSACGWERPLADPGVETILAA